MNQDRNGPGMTLADSHVKALLKEGTTRHGAPPSGAEWRVSPEAIAAAKKMTEDFVRDLGAASAANCGAAKRSTLKAEDVRMPAPPAPSTGM